MAKKKKAIEFDNVLKAFDLKTLDAVKTLVEHTALHGINIYKVFGVLVDEQLARYKSQARDVAIKRARSTQSKRKQKLTRARMFQTKAEKRRATQARGRYANAINSYERVKTSYQRDNEQMQTLPPIHECPRCGGVVRGMLIPWCEFEKSGRRFYRECDDCSFYCETFVIDDKVEYREGD